MPINNTILLQYTTTDTVLHIHTGGKSVKPKSGVVNQSDLICHPIIDLFFVVVYWGLIICFDYHSRKWTIT